MIKIFGVDFSGAQNAGEKIWVSRALQIRGELTFDFLAPAIELVDESDDDDEDYPDHTAIFRGLVSWLQNELRPGDRVGFDFPFALTAENLGGLSWRDWIFSLGKFEDVEEFRAAFSDGKRACDIRAKTPFSPLNLRLYRQTFFGMRDVLRPLLAGGAIAVPFEDPRDDAPFLLEICPASLLKSEGLYLSYKGSSTKQLFNRHHILKQLQEGTSISIPDAIVERALENREGDALDAIIAALCVARQSDFSAQEKLEIKEGRIYF